MNYLRRFLPSTLVPQPSPAYILHVHKTACSALKKQRAPCSNYSVACENRYCHSAVGEALRPAFFIQVELCTLAIHFSACIYIYIHICFFMYFDDLFTCVYFLFLILPLSFCIYIYIYVYAQAYIYIYIHTDILCIFYLLYIYIYISCEIYSLMCNILYIIFVICDLNTFLIHFSNVVKYMAVFFNMCIFRKGMMLELCESYPESYPESCPRIIPPNHPPKITIMNVSCGIVWDCIGLTSFNRLDTLIDQCWPDPMIPGYLHIPSQHECHAHIIIPELAGSGWLARLAGWIGGWLMTAVWLRGWLGSYGSCCCWLSGWL